MRRKVKPAVLEREDVLIRRAQRLSRRGDDRKAMLAAREACFASPKNARLWALYGALCFRARRRDDALHAFGQSLWIRQRAKDQRRVAVLEKLIRQVELGADDLRAA
jgi:Flp pilus assembly protein TadD